MQLWFAPTSPFARKTRIAAHELGLFDRIEMVEVDPWTDPRLRALNPLSKVPTLVCTDETVLYESAVICEYLDSLGNGRLLFPPPGPARWRTLLMQGLADGASTAAGRLLADERRPAGERSAAMMQRFAEAIDAALDRLDREPPADIEPLIGDIAIAASSATSISVGPIVTGGRAGPRSPPGSASSSGARLWRRRSIDCCLRRRGQAG